MWDTLQGRFAPPPLMSGTWDIILCHILHSSLFFAALNCSSSYNLCFMSVERTLSVMWPLKHRILISRRRVGVFAVLLWPAGLILMTAFSIPANGTTSVGGCHFWTKLTVSMGRIHGITFNAVFFAIPGIVMLLSYALLWRQLAIRQASNSANSGGGGTRECVGKVKCTVIRTLATCVILFIVCHLPRSTISLMFRFTSTDIFSSFWFTAAIALSLCNNLVNPCVYAVQYSDYKKELRRQIRRLLRIKRNSVSTSDEDSIRTIDRTQSSTFTNN